MNSPQNILPGCFATQTMKSGQTALNAAWGADGVANLEQIQKTPAKRKGKRTSTPSKAVSTPKARRQRNANNTPSIRPSNRKKRKRTSFEEPKQCVPAKKQLQHNDTLPNSSQDAVICGDVQPEQLDIPNDPLLEPLFTDTVPSSPSFVPLASFPSPVQAIGSYFLVQGVPFAPNDAMPNVPRNGDVVVLTRKKTYSPDPSHRLFGFYEARLWHDLNTTVLVHRENLFHLALTWFAAHVYLDHTIAGTADGICNCEYWLLEHWFDATDLFTLLDPVDFYTVRERPVVPLPWPFGATQ